MDATTSSTNNASAEQADEEKLCTERAFDPAFVPPWTKQNTVRAVVTSLVLSVLFNFIVTYIGSTGDTYRGSWVMNLKHRHGTKSYSNGDYCDGEWRRGLQDGQGRYQWKNGNNYTGQFVNRRTMDWLNFLWGCSLQRHFR